MSCCHTKILPLVVFLAKITMVVEYTGPELIAFTKQYTIDLDVVLSWIAVYQCFLWNHLKYLWITVNSFQQKSDFFRIDPILAGQKPELLLDRQKFHLAWMVLFITIAIWNVVWLHLDNQANTYHTSVFISKPFIISKLIIIKWTKCIFTIKIDKYTAPEV